MFFTLLMKRSLLAITLLTCVPVFTWAQTVAGTTWMTEQYPPYNYKDENGKPAGIAVDVLLKIFEKVNAHVERGALKILPWARSYRMLQSESGTALFSMTYTPERQKLFDFVGPVVTSHVSLIARKDRHLKITNVSQINQYKIGAIRDDIGDQLLRKSGVKDSNIQLSAKAENMVKKLEAGRVDFIAYDPRVSAWQMKNVGIDPNLYAPVFTLKEGKMGYAFYKGTDPAMLETLQKALDGLKADGSTQKIADKYLK